MTLERRDQQVGQERRVMEDVGHDPVLVAEMPHPQRNHLRCVAELSI
jgi:hypothetical protein